MINKRNQELRNFLRKNLGIVIDVKTCFQDEFHHILPEDSLESVASIFWDSGDRMVCADGYRCIDSVGSNDDLAFKRMIDKISGKDLFQAKNWRWHKKVSLPEFSCLSELKMKLEIMNGDQQI